MPVVGPGVAELRVRGEDGQFRVFYFAASEMGILVVHAFAKKTQQTPPSDIKLARKRLAVSALIHYAPLNGRKAEFIELPILQGSHWYRSSG